MTLAPDSLGPTVCIGEILAEVVATTPGAGFCEPQPMVGPYPSGAPAIFIDQCGRFGGAAAMIGAVGEDDFGRMAVDRLRRDGVDTSAIARHAELPTGTAFVRYRADGNRDFQFNLWTSAAGRLDWSEAVAALVARAGHLHVMGTLLGQPAIWPLIERAAGIIRQRGGSISLDPNMRKELQADAGAAARVAAMVRMTDLLLPSDDELFLAAGLAPEAGEDAALGQLFAMGPSEVVIKSGQRGATCHEAGGTSTRSPAFKVTEVDPTGAGDCFGGAYVAARRLGLPLADALTYANAAGARNVTFRGPMEGAGTRAELDGFIQQTERAT